MSSFFNRARRWLMVCVCLLLLSLAETVYGYPMSMASQNPSMDDVLKEASSEGMAEVAEFGRHRENFLRSFCRYCHSQPFFCGELLELCYARFRL